ncbi:unnamed protein product [Protopolystoma xenopodis]|uniref:C2 domain-containing protein n=1 Tax=Protopolystoma xenopodis TaxID=117903 RepID=A0A3S5BB74_9PLAT|nr:unnamed protein product [Protopolystoma xenopodis]
MAVPGSTRSVLGNNVIKGRDFFDQKGKEPASFVRVERMLIIPFNRDEVQKHRGISSKRDEALGTRARYVRKESLRTKVRYASRSPVWNEKFEFPTSLKQLSLTCIDVHVFDINSSPITKKKEEIGCFRIGRMGRRDGREHWAAMLAKPNYAALFWYYVFL